MSAPRIMASLDHRRARREARVRLDRDVQTGCRRIEVAEDADYLWSAVALDDARFGTGGAEGGSGRLGGERERASSLQISDGCREQHLITQDNVDPSGSVGGFGETVATNP